MPRKPRIWYPGAWYHVMARGNNKEAVFFTSRDYSRYVSILGEALGRFDTRLHTYALMPNHVHLLIETGQRYPISAFMQWLHTTYTAQINAKYKRVGHLFQGRYKGILVEQDTYLLQLSRYIHLNPVRARLAVNPAHYPWSSYRAYVLPSQSSVVTSEFVLSLLGTQPERQARSYRDFVEGSDPNRKSPEAFVLGV